MEYAFGFVPYCPTWRHLRRQFNINFRPTELAQSNNERPTAFFAICWLPRTSSPSISGSESSCHLLLRLYRFDSGRKVWLDKSSYQPPMGSTCSPKEIHSWRTQRICYAQWRSHRPAPSLIRSLGVFTTSFPNRRSIF
jgi:hypothetical protein